MGRSPRVLPADARTAKDLLDAYLRLILAPMFTRVKLVPRSVLLKVLTFLTTTRNRRTATRQAVNKWIRTSGSFDGMIDFDAVLRDSDYPADSCRGSLQKIAFIPTMLAIGPWPMQCKVIDHSCATWKSRWLNLPSIH